MEQIIEFIGNHPLLVGSLIALVAILIASESRKGGKSISSQAVTTLINHQNGIVLDVREKADFSKGHIVDAVSMPHGKVTERMGELNKHKDKPIIVVDTMGQHSGSVVKQLKEAGFEQVVRLQGGIGTWTSDNLPLVKK